MGTVGFADSTLLINEQLTAIRVEHALVAYGTVAADAADAERGARVALLPVADEGGLADEGHKRLMYSIFVV